MLCSAETYFQNLPGRPTLSLTSPLGSSLFVLGVHRRQRWVSIILSSIVVREYPDIGNIVSRRFASRLVWTQHERGVMITTCLYRMPSYRDFFFQQKALLDVLVHSCTNSPIREVTLLSVILLPSSWKWDTCVLPKTALWEEFGPEVDIWKPVLDSAGPETSKTVLQMGTEVLFMTLLAKCRQTFGAVCHHSCK